MSISYVDTLEIDAGEKIHIISTVKPTCDSEEPFTIREAKYQIADSKGTILDEGDCEIRDHDLDAFVSMDIPGTFFLRLSYKIADETWVDKFRLKVGRWIECEYSNH